MAPPLLIHSFLIADAVIQDRQTGKWTVVGIFDKIYGASFPCVHPSLALYVKFADAQGRYRVKVEFRDSEDKLISAFERIEFEVKDRLRGGDFGVATHGLPLEKPGRYQFQLYLNDEFAASVPLDVYKVEKPPAPPPPPPPA